MEKIGDGVYHLPDIVGGPSILVGETVVLVDTGVPGSDDAILAAVEEIGRERRGRHGHRDHACRRRPRRLARGARRPNRRDRLGRRARGGRDRRQGHRPAAATRIERRHVDRRFVPGETLPLQGGIETVDTHGHTAGHVSLFLPRERILIAGDAINNVEGPGRIARAEHGERGRTRAPRCRPSPR